MVTLAEAHMAKLYSVDLRERLLAHVEAGHSCRAAARVLGVLAALSQDLA